MATGDSAIDVPVTAVGITLLVARHSDPIDVVVRLALAVHLPLTSEAFGRRGRELALS